VSDIPRVLIERILVDDRELNVWLNTLLPPQTSRIQVDYTALSLAAANKVRFRYRMDGFDQEWVDAGARRQAFYTNLAPRSYRFRVTTSDASGDGANSEAVWAFTIRPAFYQTRWFLAVMALLA
jgi:hypothetical protein